MKKILLFLFMLFSSLLISNKVNALTNYCEFGNLKLSLPTTISVEIEGFNYAMPFDNYDKYRYSKSHHIYDEDSCTTPIELPYIYTDNNGLSFITNNYKTYCVNVSFYYYYNNTKHLSFHPLLVGKYSYTDTLSPTIEILNNNLKISMGVLYDIENLKRFVTVKDDSSINITPNIIYNSYTDNYNIPGIYQIIYEACDNFSNCSKEVQNITVIDDIKPTITGDPFITSYMSNPTTISQISNSLKATDNHDGDITHNITMIDSSYNFDKPGKYFITFSAKDKSGNEVKEVFRVDINYIDDIAPLIEGPTKFTSYLSKKLSTKDIISNLISYDNVDGNVLENLYVKSDQYTNNLNKIGSYNLVISCFDKSGNESLPYIVTIEVIDDVSPEIQGPTIYTSNLSVPVTVSNIKNKLIAMDNHDGNITHKLELIQDTYSLNIQTIGVYHLSFIAKDSSNNESNLFTIEITNIDDILPTIEGENYLLTTTDKKIDIFSLSKSLKAIDNIDGDISHEIELNENNYDDNYYKPGVYYLTYYVCDKSGNISLPFKIKIVVNNNLSYINSINDSILYLDTSTLLSKEEIFKTLNIKLENYYLIKEIDNTYTLNYSIPGQYKLTYEITNTDYSKEYLNLKINTYKKEENNNINNSISYTKQKKKETIFSHIVSFFQNLFFNIFFNIKKLFR